VPASVVDLTKFGQKSSSDSLGLSGDGRRQKADQSSDLAHFCDGRLKPAKIRQGFRLEDSKDALHRAVTALPCEVQAHVGGR